MPPVHVVQQGECLSTIAGRYGLPGWRALYDDPLNAELRRLRTNPHILHPGDLVAIPEPRRIRLSTDQTHRVRIEREPIRLKLRVVEDLDGRVCTGRFRLEVDVLAEPIEGALDDGCLDEQIPSTARRARLHLLEDDGSSVARTFELRIGTLDPLDTVSGVQARLRRLGYRLGKIDGGFGPRTSAAVRAFQAAEGISDEDEPYGRATLDRLRERIGH